MNEKNIQCNDNINEQTLENTLLNKDHIHFIF